MKTAHIFACLFHLFFFFYFIKTANIDCHIKCFTSIHLTDNLLNIFVLLLCFYKIGLQRMYLTVFFSDGGKKIDVYRKDMLHTYRAERSIVSCCMLFSFYSENIFRSESKQALKRLKWWQKKINFILGNTFYSNYKPFMITVYDI